MLDDWTGLDDFRPCHYCGQPGADEISEHDTNWYHRRCVNLAAEAQAEKVLREAALNPEGQTQKAG